MVWKWEIAVMNVDILWMRWWTQSWTMAYYILRCVNLWHEMFDVKIYIFWLAEYNYENSNFVSGEMEERLALAGILVFPMDTKLMRSFPSLNFNHIQI